MNSITAQGALERRSQHAMPTQRQAVRVLSDQGSRVRPKAPAPQKPPQGQGNAPARVVQKQMTPEEIKRQRMQENLLKDDLAEIVPYLDEPTVTDVAVLDSGEIIVTRFGKGKEFTGTFLPEYIVERIIKATAAIAEKPIASYTGFPILEAVLPKYKARITGLMPPVTSRPEIQIRKRPEKIYSLEDYVRNNQMTREQYETLVAAIRDRKNILVCGGTGSGKTTCTNAIIKKMNEFTPDDNFYIVEDTPELQSAAKMQTMLCVKKEHSMKAVEESLRFTPERVIFGEVRTGEVMASILDSWKTGHPGNVTTFHANNARSAILRIREMAEHTGSVETVNHLSEVIQLIVHLRKTPEGIRMDEMVRITEATDREIQQMTFN